MSKIKLILTITLSLLCGLLFIYSAYTKLFPVEPLEYSLADIGFNWGISPFIARFLIGAEFALGFLFILLFRLRKITLPLAFCLLLAFTAYFLLLISEYGNRGSCGCFGETIKMTPLQGLMKNGILVIAFFILYAISSEFTFRFKTLLASAGSLILIILPFVVNPIGIPFEKRSPDTYEQFKLELDSLYYRSDSTEVPPAIDLKQGKHIIVFLSLSCPHCRIAAKKLNVMYKRNPQIPLYFVIGGKAGLMKEFFDDTKADNIPYMYLHSKEKFLELTHGKFPRIYWVNNSIVEFDPNYYELNEDDLLAWLKKK
jgi:hypothetical protein